MNELNLDKFAEELFDIKSVRYNKKYNKVAKIHKYWSRKPWYIIEKQIENYTKKDFAVLDPFCGSGITGLEAMLRECNYIGYDLNPIAIEISKCTLELDFDPVLFEIECLIIKNDLKSKIMPLYKLDSNLYIKYFIAGVKNTKNYNCIATDYNFKKNYYLTIEEDVLKKKYKIPKDLKYPDMPFPKKFYKDRFSYKGVKKVSDMFSSRNLLSMAIIYNYLQSSKFKYKDLFIMAFSNTILHVSKLKSENVRPLNVNNYWIPDDYIEENVIWRFLDRAKNIKEAKEVLLKRKNHNKLSKKIKYKLYNKSSLAMPEVKDNSIDYIITDPPYGDAIQYSELSYIWNCWINNRFNINEEVVINPVQNKGISEFHIQFKQFVQNAKRVLKKDAFFTLCFQNKSLDVWLGIIDTIRREGFTLKTIEIYDTFGSPYNKHWAKFSPKSDFYVTFVNSYNSFKESPQNVEPLTIINNIIDYLNGNNGNTIDLNKAYDLFVASVVHEAFEGFCLDKLKTYNLKKLLNIFNQARQDGTLQETCDRNFQMQLFV